MDGLVRCRFDFRICFTFSVDLYKKLGAFSTGGPKAERDRPPGALKAMLVMRRMLLSFEKVKIEKLLLKIKVLLKIKAFIQMT